MTEKMPTSNSAIRNCAFAFKCTKSWNDLQPTQTDSVRTCSDCQRDVYFCRTNSDLAKAIKENRCVAVKLPGAKKAPRLLGMPRRMGSQEEEDLEREQLRKSLGFK